MTKIAHARYIAEGYPVRVVGFRQLTYHADYIEPRSSTRHELLDASYRSALDQCRKAGIAVNSRVFILEDTSVRINALSKEAEEVPGLDIKFWMKDMTFKKLDRLLRKKGNDRSVSVRSDVLLHLPQRYRNSWGEDEEYRVFTGVQEGSVIEHEIDFESNLVFPWLDNQSFNKWFQPRNAGSPLGSLGIDEANLFDFRRFSLRKALEYLEDKGLLTRQPLQAELPLDSATDLILCGYTCAGKTVASQHLARTFGYKHIEASDFMYLSYYQRHGYEANVAIADFAERALEVKPEIVAEQVVEYLEGSQFSRMVLSGFRNIKEVAWLVNRLAYSGRQIRLKFVQADQSARFQRLKDRRRFGDDIGREELERRDQQQQRMGLDEIARSECAEIWDNNGTLEDYYALVESSTTSPRIDQLDFEIARTQLSRLPNVGLEESILIALLSKWSEDENRPYFTTSQIAAIISRIFEKIKPKHKDNVSRYFNQDFHPDYEVTGGGRAGARKYRLSNTGFGRALLALSEVGNTRPTMQSIRKIEGQELPTVSASASASNRYLLQQGSLDFDL